MSDRSGWRHDRRRYQSATGRGLVRSYPVSDGVDQHRFVFVGGLPRSGTTLLAAEIARSPGVSNLEGIGVVADEGQYVQSVYTTQRDAGGIGRFAYSPDMHLTEHSPHADRSSRDSLWRDWAPYWDTSKEVLVEKTPSNLLKMRFLQAVFPGSAFVVVVRHPVAEAMAIRSRGWSGRPASKLIDHWVTAHAIMTGDLPAVDRVVVVRYEDLVAHPAEVLRGLQDFLEIAPVPTGDEPRQGLNDRYFDEWASHGWRARVDNRRVVRRFESAIGAFGYSFASPNPVGPLAADLPTLDLPDTPSA